VDLRALSCLHPAEAPRIRHYQQRNSKDKYACCTSSRCQFKGIKRQHAMLIATATATAVLVFSQSNSLSERGPLTGKGSQEFGTTSNVHLKWSSKASITCLHSQPSQPFQLTLHLSFILEEIISKGPPSAAATPVPSRRFSFVHLPLTFVKLWAHFVLKFRQ
jgi:hypothetical protein